LAIIPFQVWHPAFLRFHELYAKNPREEIKLKQKKEMAALLELITRLLQVHIAYRHTHTHLLPRLVQDYSTPGIPMAEPEEIRLRTGSDTNLASEADLRNGGSPSTLLATRMLRRRASWASPNAVSHSTPSLAGGASDGKPSSKLKLEEQQAMAELSQRNKFWTWSIAAAAAAVTAYNGGVGEAAAAKAAVEAAIAAGANEAMANIAANAAILTTIEGGGVAAAGVAGFEAVAGVNEADAGVCVFRASVAAGAHEGGTGDARRDNSGGNDGGGNVGGNDNGDNGSGGCNDDDVARGGPQHSSSANTCSKVPASPTARTSLPRHCSSGQNLRPESAAFAHPPLLRNRAASVAAAFAGAVASKLWEEEGGESLDKLAQIRDVLERWQLSGINRKLQFKPCKWRIATKKIRRKKNKNNLPAEAPAGLPARGMQAIVARPTISTTLSESQQGGDVEGSNQEGGSKEAGATPPPRVACRRQH
jgi:hypothetical protein